MEPSLIKYLRQTLSLTRYFVSTRGLEVLLLQASPVLGVFFGGLRPGDLDMRRPACLLLGSLALTAHAFLLNDWAGYHQDLPDPRRTESVLSQRGIPRGRIIWATLILLFIAISLFAVLGYSALLFGLSIAIISFVYSCVPGFGKSSPILGSINHLFGGALHFLLGYSTFHPVDLSGIELSLFFGLVFAGGHLNQEVRDYEGDSFNKIRTNAVVFGCRPTFLASMAIFTGAYAVIAGFAVLQSRMDLLTGSLVVWILHSSLFLHALNRGLSYNTACWMQRRYRILLAIIGFMMILP